MSKKYNLFFCLDKNLEISLEYVFKSFILHNNPTKFNIHFIVYNYPNPLNIELILKKISPEFNIIIKEFQPSKKFIDILKKYENLLQSNFTLIEKCIKKRHKKNREKLAHDQIKTYCNVGNWSRFYINEMFPDIHYGLYLDLDILFTGDISDIFSFNINNNAIGVVPYAPPCTLKKIPIIERNIMIDPIEDIKFLDLYSINYDDFNNFAYNCGVIYFNFFKFRKLKIKKKIENIIKYMCSNKKLLYISGTELIQNICLPKYTEIPQCYNFIPPTGKFTQKHIQESKIMHFKGFFVKPWNMSENQLKLFGI